MKKPSSGTTTQISLFRQQPAPEPFKKAVQVVHSKPRGQVTFVQRKTLNALIRNAVKTKNEDGWWSIRTTDLARDIGFDSNNRDYLRQATLDLMSMVFEWDVLAAKTKGAWLKASILFTDIEITNERILYKLNSELQTEVLDPAMYALVDMQLMRQMKKSASLAIYEFCIRFERIGHTAVMPWGEFRDMILGEGRHTNTYKEYKYFKQKILKPAVAEINSLGEMHLTLKEVTSGRRIEAISFDIVKIAPSVTETDLPSEELLLLVGELVELGLVQSEAKKLLREADSERIRTAIELTKRRMSDIKGKPLDKPAAYFRAAFKNEWAFEDAKIVRATTKAKTAEPASRKTKSQILRDRYMANQMAEAEAYFKERDEADQTEILQRYNDQQPTAGLRIGKKPGKAATVGFFTWLGLDTWGEPTPEDLLAFATETLVA